MRVPKLMQLLLLASIAVNAHADWKELLDMLPQGSKDAVSASEIADVTGLSSEEITAGLKEALTTATEIAVNALGQEGGFLDNPAVRIPMPEQLSRVEKGLRQMGQEEMADEFVATLNHAAEQAVPVALEQFQGAIEDMTVEDAESILTGPEDAATQYFRKQSEAALREQFLPIVQETTANAGVTSSYQNIMKQLGSFSSFLQPKSLDLDEYVTDEALNGLFEMVAQEEMKIRQDPVARTSDLLKKVFASN